jgi:hypothetical protein
VERILVAYGGADAATGVVGLAVGEQLSRAGFQVDVRPCRRAVEPTGYRAVVIGSAVQEGRWESSALDYAGRHAVALAERPTWLYQLAVSPPPVPVDDSTAEVLGAVGGDEPVTFDPQHLVPDFDNPLRRLALLRRRSTELTEWGRVRLWGLLLANELPALAGA